MIKFRAWDNENETYLYDVQKAYDMFGGTVKYVDGADANYEECCFGDFLSNRRYDVEQFTGLTDETGKDIYEGDILENRKYRSIVKFASGKFLADLIETIQTFDLIGETHGSKVIGNVHENPELLEADK
ncbi:YopX family protein [Lactiplantibacillus plantarum]|uniref:YopX family protein n=1 Tax=Lactiplantibacillus plantarum TaxID=1590 RepID=UPI002ADDE1A7|nr:YopX family protein [Lactiplantibacillus plantarum]MEA0993633.1 YopX family protein [Lactiplantibacillus plantarum]MEA1033550.1 YopX family protein [Lactiplantibacillus plantarum]